MKKVLKLSMIAMVAGLVVGCATNSDIENLQSQIDGLKTNVAQVSADVQVAQNEAINASAKATAAESAANRAAQFAQDTNSKLDNMFQKAMVK